MFNYRKMIERAIEFFPLWTDIRKRYKKSLGGNFLSSVIEEEIKIEEKIQEYIDSYFLYNYIDHEDEVMDYVYMTAIGHLSSIKNVFVYYNEKFYPFTESIADFEEFNSYVFYENGYIYFKEDNYIKDLNNIVVMVDDVESLYEIKRVHVWNIFDEFATFVNTRRQENETNKQLLDRILYITKNLPNGTEDGLKHAIISELMTDFPDLTEDEIIIERPTPENLVKPYEDYETLLDMLAEVNRDVYRTKRWDLDYWEYDFESISYIPHMWNKAIYDWQNGVGSYDDLQVIISDKEQATTDATIHLYKKTLEAFQKYVYDKYIDINLDFQLTRYNDILNKTNIKYKILASELKEITHEDIKLKLHESKKRKDNLALEDISISWGKDVEIIENNILTDLDSYRLEFKNAENSYNLIITQAQVLYNNKDTNETEEVLDLLQERNGFVLNSEYELVSEANRQTITAIEHFTNVENLVNNDEGITIESGYSEGTGVLSLTDMARLDVGIDYECDMIDIPKSLINDFSGYWHINNKKEDEFVVRGDYSTETKTFSFSINANHVSFNIDNNNNMDAFIQLELIDNGASEIIDLSHDSFFETDITTEPRPLTFSFEIISPNDVFLSNFKYNNYFISLETKNGIIEKLDDKTFKLPNFYNNELILRLETKSAETIVVKGLYIGEDFFNVKYLTDLIPARDNCVRSLEIKTNGVMNLLRYNSDGALIEEKKEYDTACSYKGLSEDAFVRVDLSSYDSISDIQADPGSVEIIEESGVRYFNIRLKTNQILKRITVTGIKTYEAREVTLEDMIRFYIPDYDATHDKIYCSKCSKGLIVGRTNPKGTPYNELVNIQSEIFKGLKIVKYVMELPSYLGSIYGSNNGYENRSKTATSVFDYISFYPANAQLYQAINEYDTYLSENKFIPIVNNFTPILNTALSLFYRIENFNAGDKNNVIIKFHNKINADSNIEDMQDWSIGTSSSYVAIKNNIDLLNNSTYDITTYNINEANYLSTSIDIKDSYTITDHTILNTERFIVSTNNENVSIKYDYYNGTEKKAHLLKFENIYTELDGFNKLIYSNIDTVYHCSLSPFEGKYLTDVSFEILKEQGIIIWKDSNIINKNIKVYLVYSIKKPIAFIFNLDYLYKAIDYDVEAYEQIGQYELKNKKNKESINLLTQTESDLRTDYSECDLMKVSCSEPTFEARLENDTLLFHKYIEEDYILIKTGYYYINGREYYLYSEDDAAANIENNSFYTSNNIDISGGEIITYKESDNYVSNTEMRLKGMANLYSFDCSKDLTYGVSSLNYLTSCESFNEWNEFEMRMKLVNGLNGLALQFIPTLETGYAFLDITDSLVDYKSNYISFYASDTLQVYIGKEYKYLNINFSRSLNIELDHEIIYDNSDIRYTVINKLPNERYYLIVQNSGVIDDIIISTDGRSIYESHTKNITLLGLDLYEKKPEGTRYRMSLTNHKDYKSYSASLMSDGSIKTTSDLDWYVTEFKTFTKDEDFKSCEIFNVGVNADCIYTDNNPGYIQTMPIRLGNLDNIERIIIKINDIELNAMSGFSSCIYTSDEKYGTYIPCCNLQYENKFNIPANFLRSYIKLRVDIPVYKYINNITIFVEYFSTNDNPMPITAAQTGYIESRVYDLQQESNCIVKSIDIQDISNINDIDIYIRASKDNERLDVWSNWRKININDDLKIINTINFLNTRFLQYKIIVKNRSGYIKFKSIDVEIK